jgi:hypothetical protein
MTGSRGTAGNARPGEAARIRGSTKAADGAKAIVRVSRRESIVLAQVCNDVVGQVCNGVLAQVCNGDCSAAESFAAVIENIGQQHTTGLPR